PPPRSFAPVPPRPNEPLPAEPEVEPLALSAEQILRDTAADDEGSAGMSFNELIGNEPPSGTLVDPDDIAFDTDPEPVAPPPSPRPAPAYERPRPAAVAQAAPLPDPRLTSDMAEQLLEPTTQSVINRSFARRSEERRVGKERRPRWQRSPEQKD